MKKFWTFNESFSAGLSKMFSTQLKEYHKAFAFRICLFPEFDRKNLEFRQRLIVSSVKLHLTCPEIQSVEK